MKIDLWLIIFYDLNDLDIVIVIVLDVIIVGLKFGSY